MQCCGMAVIERRSMLMGRRWRSGSGRCDIIQSSGSDPASAAVRGTGVCVLCSCNMCLGMAVSMPLLPRRMVMAPGGAELAMERHGRSQGTNNDVSGSAPRSSGEEQLHARVANHHD